MMIRIKVEDVTGGIATLEIPEGINLNLMETLKAYEYDVRATCGGMALCADCHCQVLYGEDKLVPAQNGELITLDTRPDAGMNSRLACQIKVTQDIDGLFIKIMGNAD